MSPEGIWISIKGAEQIRRALSEAGAAAASILEEATVEAAELIRDEAERLAPRAAGRLAANIETKVTKKETNEVEVAVGPDVGKPSRKARRSFYGMFVEFGTQAHILKPRRAKALRIGDEFRAAAQHPGHRPRPFMRPAFDSKCNKAQDKIAEVLKRKLGL